MVGRHIRNFVKLSLEKCKFWLFTTIIDGKEDEQRSNRLKCIRAGKSISENRAASTELPKKTTASQIIGLASSTLTTIGTTQHQFTFSPIFETICLYFLVTYS